MIFKCPACKKELHRDGREIGYKGMKRILSYCEIKKKNVILVRKEKNHE